MTSRFELAPWIITTGGPAAPPRPDVENVEPAAGDLDHPALGGIEALQDKDTGLRDQRQDRQRRHEDD